MAVIIDTTKCNGVDACPAGGLCIEICALNAMENVGGRPVVNKEACPECGLCVMNCPNEAISKPDS
ncbi:MAG: 4Fe-4S binding protein [Methanosphaera sp.]|nr:4Fe-4S binding protein [Methanosphaera sp.]